MKQIFSAAFILLLFSACKNESANETAAQKAAIDTANFTTIKWIDSIVQFGSINKGEKIEIKFRCQNTGSKPLLLVNVRPGCGCTVADYTKQPIMPGSEGLVTASFDSQKVGSSGQVRKTIIVNTNTKNGTEHYLYFEGTMAGGVSNDKIVEPHAVDTTKIKH